MPFPPTDENLLCVILLDVNAPRIANSLFETLQYIQSTPHLLSLKQV